MLVIVEVGQADDDSLRQRLNLEEPGLGLVIEPQQARHGSRNASDSRVNMAVRLVAKNLARAAGIVGEYDVRSGRSTAEQRANGRRLLRFQNRIPMMRNEPATT